MAFRTPSYKNTIPENVNHVFAFGVAVPQATSFTVDGVVGWTAIFSQTDLNGNGNSTDLLNPVTLIDSSNSNDAYDDVVVGFTEQDAIRVVTLHELGHSLYIRAAWSCGNEDCHEVPTSQSGSVYSVMRSGFGPARVTTFTPDDIAQMKLRL